MVTTAAAYPTPLTAMISMEPLSPATSPTVAVGGGNLTTLATPSGGGQHHIVMHTDQMPPQSYSPSGTPLGHMGEGEFDEFNTTPNSESDFSQHDSKRKRKFAIYFASLTEIHCPMGKKTIV